MLIKLNKLQPRFLCKKQCIVRIKVDLDDSLCALLAIVEEISYEKEVLVLPFENYNGIIKTVGKRTFFSIKSSI
jgi:hypothetical protein